LAAQEFAAQLRPPIGAIDFLANQKEVALGV
jgi:hypothetical protein